MSVEVRLLERGEGGVLDRVAPDVFDEEVDPRWLAEFLADARHHLAVAIDGTTVVGFASAVHYVHPDKAPELWINEVGVAPAYQRRGLGRRLLTLLLHHGRELGCVQGWVLTTPTNTAALGLYEAVGGRADAEPCVLIEFPLRPLDPGTG